MEAGETDYSISEAKNNLPRLIHEAEAGKGVAVLLSRSKPGSDWYFTSNNSLTAISGFEGEAICGLLSSVS